MGFPNGGEGGGGPPLGKNSHIFPFFLGGSVPNEIKNVWTFLQKFKQLYL